VNLNNNIDKVLKHIEIELLWDKSFLSELMNYDVTSLEKAKPDPVPFNSIVALSDFLGVSIEQIADNNIDYKQVKRKFITPSLSIPDHHTVAAGSYITSLRCMYNFVKNKFNQKTATEMLKTFQIDTAVLRNDNIMINLKLINDILKYTVEKLNFTKQDILNMAIRGYVDCPRKSIINLVKDTQTDKEILQAMVSISNLYEKNFSYKLDIVNETKFVLRSESNPEFNEALKTNKLSTEITNTYKNLAVSVVPALLGRPMLTQTGIQDYNMNGIQYVNYTYKENSLLCL
jgi:hypothetical protein